MKLYKFFAGVAVAAFTVAATGCSDDFDRPPVIFPESDLTVNTTILELKEKYYKTESNYMETIGFTESGDHIIIGGRVVSSDEMGNVYQRIILEDETAAIPVRVYTTNLYETYHYGQEVRIDVTDMKIGSYSGWVMIGADYNGSIGGMDKTLMDERAQVNGLPQESKITEYEVTIPQLMAAKSVTTEFLSWQSRLVTLKEVTFVDGGRQPFGTPGGTNYTTRKLKDENGNTIDISTSNKCQFVGTTMPTGTGTVKAILSYFGGNWQLVFSDPATDCIGFDEMPDVPVTPGTDAVASLSEDFEGGSIPAGWTETVTSGNRNWLVKSFNSNFYAQCSAYQGTAGSEGFKSWLITPAIDFDAMTEKTMSFQTEIQYSGDSNLQLYVMNSDDPKTAEMVELTFTQPQPSADDKSTGYLFSGEVSLAQFTGVKYIAWLYTASDPNKSRTYRVDNVRIGMNASSVPDTPVTGTAKFKKATAVTAGKSYVMVVAGKVGTPVPANDSFGRLSMADVTIEGDELTTNLTNAIVINAADGAYTLTDTYGRLLGMDASHLTSFQLYTAMQPTGCTWTISFNADGTAAIANVLNPTCNVVRSGTFTNIAPSDIVQYPTFDAPVLYEKVD